MRAHAQTGPFCAPTAHQLHGSAHPASADRRADPGYGHAGLLAGCATGHLGILPPLMKAFPGGPGFGLDHVNFLQLLEADVFEIVNGKIAPEFVHDRQIAGDGPLRNLQVARDGPLGPALVGETEHLAAASGKLLTVLSFHRGDSCRVVIWSVFS